MAEDDEDFAAMFEASLQKRDASAPRRQQLKKGEVVDAIVVALSDDTVFVDVGTKSEGRIDRSEIDPGRAIALGDKLRATVADPGRTGPPRLHVALRGGSIDTETLQLAAQSGAPVEGTFTKAVKAGIEVDMSGARAFCPASQVDLAYVGDLEAFVGQRHFFRVLEVRDSGRSIVVSRKALLQAERAEQAASLRRSLAPGQVLQGIVQSVQPYGAFIDLGGLQGLVHVSEMSRAHVASPSDVVSVGEPVTVQVLSIDPGTSGQPDDVRVSLSMKAIEAPTATPAAQPAEIISGTITRMEAHGLFVDTPAGSGFVPVAELPLPPGGDPRRAFEVGGKIDVVPMRRDAKGRARFSASAVEEVQARKDFATFTEHKGRASLGSLGDLLRGKLPDAPAPKKAAPAPERAAPAPTGDASRTRRRIKP